MQTDSSITVDAPVALVWDVYSDVERWPEWTASVTRVVAPGGPGIAVGKRFAIKQPRMPKLDWTVIDVVPGASWTWQQRSPGAVTTARHEVSAIDARHTLVRQQLEQRGPVGALLGRFMLTMTKRYLEMEARGLKTRIERPPRLDAPTR